MDMTDPNIRRAEKEGVPVPKVVWHDCDCGRTVRRMEMCYSCKHWACRHCMTYDWGLDEYFCNKECQEMFDNGESAK